MPIISKGGSTVAWSLDVADRGGEGNSREYSIVVRPQNPGSHINGNATWDFTILGEWEMAEFAAVVDELAKLVAGLAG